jgi:hypothetical protein
MTVCYRRIGFTRIARAALMCSVGSALTLCGARTGWMQTRHLQLC